MNSVLTEYISKHHVYNFAFGRRGKGFTYLMWLCNLNGYESMKNNYILTQQDISEINSTNENGWTALLIGCYYLKNNIPIVEQIIKNGANVNIKSDNNSTALIYACLAQNNDCCESTIRLLIDAGADLNIKNYNCNTALTLSCRINNNISIIEILIKAGTTITNDDLLRYPLIKYVICKIENDKLKAENKELKENLLEAYLSPNPGKLYLEAKERFETSNK
jgi:ankyrin repeat protein